jgi:hypothetical protein
MTVVGGQTNELTLTLDGVPASVTIAPASGSQITGTQSGGFSVPFSAQPLLVNALDADGNTIVGPGTPTFTAAVTPSTGFTIAQPTLQAPNTIALGATGSGGSATVSVSAAPPNGGFSCSATGVVCTASAGIASHAHSLFLAGPSGLWMYTSPDDRSWNLVMTNATTFGYPRAIALASNGALAVFDVGTGGPHGQPGKAAIFAAPYSGAPTNNTSIGSGIAAAATPAGPLLVLSGQNLELLAAPYTGTPTVVTSGNIQTVLADPNGNAIDTSYPSATTLYAEPAYTQTSAISSSVGGEIALSSGGSIVIGNLFTSYELDILAPPITSSMPVVIPLSGQPDGGVAFDSNGNVWVALNTGHLQKYAAPFTAGESPAVDVNTGTTPNALGADSSGDLLYFAAPSVHFYDSSGANNLTIVPPSTATAMLYVK